MYVRPAVVTQTQHTKKQIKMGFGGIVYHSSARICSKNVSFA